MPLPRRKKSIIESNTCAGCGIYRTGYERGHYEWLKGIDGKYQHVQFWHQRCWDKKQAEPK